MGGGITIAAAAAYPDLFSRAVLIDSISYDVKQPFKVKMVLAPVIGRLIFMKLYGWSMFSDYFKNDVFFDAKLIDMDMLKNYYDCFNPPKRRAFSYILMKLVLNPSELAEQIPKIRLPVRILWGEHDTLVPVACGERLVREIKGSDLKIIPNAGHSCFDENPEEALARIREFLP
jgi:pimeloyl-ACP methyl ester carboxylesterase